MNLDFKDFLNERKLNVEKRFNMIQQNNDGQHNYDATISCLLLYN
jgi:hypothetical protein